ncbi:MAG: peptidase M28, partial [Gemmatimonadota bacterium]
MSAWAIPILLAATQGVTEAYGVITPELVRAHVEYLASDALLGRGPGEQGGELAARYVEAQFRRLRFQPAGTGGAYLQAVPIEVLAGDDGSTLSYRGSTG